LTENARNNPVSHSSTAVSVGRFEIPSWAPIVELWLYLMVLGIAEYVSDVKQPVVGLWLHAALAAAIITRGALMPDRRLGNFYLAFSILPVVRLVSFAISPHFVPGVWFYVFSESPMLLAAIMAARVIDLPLSALGFCRPRSLRVSAVIIMAGPFIGWLESQILHPPPLATSLQLSQIWLPSLLLIVATGFVEEAVFRGILQHTAIRALGVFPGILFCASGWALLHIGWLSLYDVFFVFAVGMVWGYVRHWNRDTIDLGIAHGLANVVLFVVVPNLHFLH
jgi:uncharacterized protein